DAATFRSSTYATWPLSKCACGQFAAKPTDPGHGAVFAGADCDPGRDSSSARCGGGAGVQCEGTTTGICQRQRRLHDGIGSTDRFDDGCVGRVGSSRWGGAKDSRNGDSADGAGEL